MTVCVAYRASQKVYCIPSTGVDISVRESAYSVRENESSVTICAAIVGGDAAIPVEVILVTVSDGNAQGKLAHG